MQRNRSVHAKDYGARRSTGSEPGSPQSPVHFPEGSSEAKGKDGPPRPPFRSAQSNQNKADEDARRQASKDLTQSWMDRLQLISVITTFFASTEAGMLQVTSPGGTGTSVAAQVANSAFLAALVLHIWAAITSFLGAFFLVRYNLKEAKEEEKDISYAPEGSQAYPLSHSETVESLFDYLGMTKLHPVWTTNPHLEQVGPFQRKPPTHLLGRIHNFCILLTFIGFALAMLGILAFAWGMNPTSVGVVTSVSTAACTLGAVIVFL